MSDTALVNVTVTRVKRLRDAGRSYKVLLDGEPVAKVAGGKSVTIAVAPGPHRIQCSLDGRTSVALGFEAEAADVAFECEAGAGKLSARSDSRYNADAYIQLRPRG